MQNVDIYDWLRYVNVIPDHRLIIIILKLANICWHCIYSKKVWPAYSKLVTLGAIFAKVLAVTLTATVTEQKNTLTSLGMVDLEIIAVNPNRQDIFYTCSIRPHTGDDKIEGLLLLHTAKLQVMREMMPPTGIYSKLHTVIVYWQYNWNIWPQNSISWLRIFLSWANYLTMY